MSLTPRSHGVCRGSLAGRIAATAVIIFGAAGVFAADVLFPQPLHITRRIEDPITRATVTLHEYCAGNQIVTVNGDRVSIVDYARQELIEIDRKAGEYSIARFDEIANAIPAPGAPQRKAATDGVASNAAPSHPRWKATALGAKSSRAGRPVDAFQLDSADESARTRIEFGVDRNVRVSRGALEALIGASFPNPRREEHDAIVTAAARPRASRTPATNDAAANSSSAAAPADEYALPVEQSLTIDSEGQTLVFRNSVLDVRNELPPDDVKSIPPGARLVESRAVRLAREMRELDLTPASLPQQ